MATVKNVDKWVSKFSSSAGTQDRTDFQQQGEQLFQPKPSPSFDEAVQGVKDVAQEVGMGMFAVPAKIATGAVGLVSPDAADALQRTGDRFKSFQEENSPGSPNQLSPEAKSLAFGGGQLLTAAGSPALAANSPKVAGALAGGLAGLSSREEGDTQTDALKRAAIGTAVGGAAATLSQVPGAVYDYSKGKLASLLRSSDKMTEATRQSIDTVNKAFKKEIMPVYKEMGIQAKAMSPEELTANQNFINSFKGEYTQKVNDQYNKALAGVKAPAEVEQFFTKHLDPEIMSAVHNKMGTSLSQGHKEAIRAPGTMKYWEEFRQTLGNIEKGSNSNTALAGQATTVMKAASKDYSDAVSMFDTKNSLADNLGSDLYKAVRTNKIANIAPLAQELSKTPTGAETVKKMYLNGMRNELVANSKLGPLEQLQRTLGRNPAEVENTLTFLRSSGQVDTADKLEALTSFVNVVSKIGPKNKSISEKLITKGLDELDGQDIQNAVMNIMEKNKFSAEFKKIMENQADHLIRSENLLSLIGRAARQVNKNYVPNVVKDAASGAGSLNKFIYNGKGQAVRGALSYQAGSAIQSNNEEGNK